MASSQWLLKVKEKMKNIQQSLTILPVVWSITDCPKVSWISLKAGCPGSKICLATASAS